MMLVWHSQRLITIEGHHQRGNPQCYHAIPPAHATESLATTNASVIKP